MKLQQTRLTTRFHSNHAIKIQFCSFRLSSSKTKVAHKRNICLLRLGCIEICVRAHKHYGKVITLWSVFILRAFCVDLSTFHTVTVHNQGYYITRDLTLRLSTENNPPEYIGIIWSHIGQKILLLPFSENWFYFCHRKDVILAIYKKTDVEIPNCTHVGDSYGKKHKLKKKPNH